MLASLSLPYNHWDCPMGMKGVILLRDGTPHPYRERCSSCRSLVTPHPALALSPMGHLKYSPFTSACEALIIVQVAAWGSGGCQELCQGHGGGLFPWGGQRTLHGWEHPTCGLGSSPLPLFPFFSWPLAEN